MSQANSTELVIVEASHTIDWLEHVGRLEAHARDLAGKLDAVMQHAIPALLDLCYCEETEEDEQCEYCERIANFRAILEPTP